MKKNYVLIFTFVAICLLTIFTPVRKVIKSVLNDVSEGSNSNKTITASFTYKDSEDNQVHDGEEIYVFITSDPNGQGSGIGIKLKANQNPETITEIYDQNWSNKNQKLENNKYYVTVVTPKNGTDDESLLNKKYEQNNFDIYESGDVYNGSYTIQFPKEIEFNEKDNFDLNIEIKGIKGKKISLEDMLSPMDTATRFGIFSLNLEISADVEATIATQKANKVTQDYGLSKRNFKALETSKIIKVDKIYQKNGNPLSSKNVKILLQQNGQTKQELDCTTDSDGKCSVEFENIENGTYIVAEQINNRIISTNETVVDEDGKSVNVEISNNIINVQDINDIDKFNYNYNYVESVGDDIEQIQLDKMRKPGILVLGTDELVTTYKSKQEFNTQNESEKVEVVKAGTLGYKTIDFASEFEHLKKLSVNLSDAIDSSNIKVYYTDHNKIENAELDFNSDNKEYILVNVDCTNATEVKVGGRNKRDGISLYDDGKPTNNSSENSDELDNSFVYNNGAKIIYNFYTKENDIIKPYSKNIKIASSTTGILLAPDAYVEGATGNHAGTIIAKDYNHTTGEVHQKVKPITNSLKANSSIINKIVEEEKREQIFEVSKVDEAGNPIVGAEVELTDEKDNVIDKWTTTGEKHRIQFELKLGEKYTIHEIKPPIGYQLANDYTFVYSGQQTITYNMVDTKIIISKLDENKNYLLGATLQILDDKGNIVEQWVSGLEDYVVQQSLEPGKTYRLHEYKAPEGYKTANDIEFTLSSDGKDQTIVMEDQKISITVKVDKKDINEKQLAGAHLQILDIYGNVVDEWISDGTIHEVTNKLEEGKKYKLHELEAPAGYQISEDIEFTVETTEKDQIVEMVDEKIVIPGEPRVIIKKTNQNKELLEGATLQILDKDGKLIEEWTTNDKEHVIQANLIAGQKYTLHEVSAPKGYKQAEDITFVAKSSDEPQVINMVDKRVKAVLGVVETLDKIARYETMFAITLSLVLLGLYIYRKYNKKYTE